jgi:hypothetical protein
MSPLTPALIGYWQRLAAEPVAARRKSLDTTRERVRSRLEPAAALVPVALCDTDEGVVEAATRAYVTAAAEADAVADAIDWIRRGLALNRGAVFGALLTLDDPATTERLAALRLLLSAAEVEVVCRVLGRSPGPAAQAFLRDWADLVADGPLQRERQALQAATGDDRRAQAA